MAGGGWLVKTEPSTYAWDDLARDRRTVWDGVKNPLALKHLASMAEGEEVFVYHTGDEKAVVGVARVARAAYPDPALEDPRRLVIDLAAVRRLPRAVSLAAMRRRDRLRGFDLLRLPRLSVIPVTAAQWREIVAMAGPAE